MARKLPNLKLLEETETPQTVTRQAMLACKATTCWWNVLDAPYFVGEGRSGRVIWIQRIKCERCGSVRIGRYPPKKVHTKDRIGGYGYERPPGWGELKIYWGDAMVRLYKENFVQLDQG
jgi:hypothetical protein